MGTLIYYFSGTGNSLHIAKELRARLPGAELAPIVRALKEGAGPENADIVGIVFPVHAFTLPLVVAEFLEKTDLTRVAYFFAFASRGCAPKVFRRAESLAGRKLDASFFTPMPENYLPMFSIEDETTRTAMEQDLQAKLDVARDAIRERRPYREEVQVGLLVRLIVLVLFPVFTFLYHSTRYFGIEKRFAADDRCTDCANCAKVCLSGKIEMKGGKPLWRKDVRCYYCLACIHNCPAEAIQIKKTKSAARPRYRHPGVTAAEIAAQK